MKSRIVPIKNVARLTQAADALINRGHGLPGMGMVSGPTGWGKTVATTWLINRVHGVYVRAFATWSPAGMLGALCRELTIAPRGSCSAMINDIIERLAREPRPIFLDEADHIVENKRSTESLRDLHDMTSVPVILIGEENLEQKLGHRKQLTGRVLEHVRFEAIDIADARLLADQLCEVKVRDDLLARVHRVARGSVRLTVVSLARIEQRAKVMGIQEIGGSEWGAKDEGFFTGEAPVAPALTNKIAAVR